MAVDPSGQTIPSTEFYTRGWSQGSNAAAGLQARSFVEEAMRGESFLQDPRYQATDADRAAYRSGFNAGYDAAYKAKSSDSSYGSAYAKTVAAEEERVKGLKTVEQWELETSIPSWSVAKAVAANFNADVDAFQSRVRASVEVTKTSEGTLWAAKYATFYAQWKSVYTAIQAQSGYSPSSAVAEVRKARSSLVALSKAFDGLSRSGAVVAPPPAPPAPPVPPPVGAKSILPTVGIIAAIATAAGGAWWMFSSKSTPKKPELLGGRP